MTDPAAEIAERFALVKDRIAGAAQRSGRNPADVLLIAVTKTHGPEIVSAAYAAGLRHFGENRVEEAEAKIGELRDRLPKDAIWHMIGHVQSRKAAQVARHFSWVHSIDRFKLARLLSEDLGREGRSIEALLEVNLSGEESKSGYDLSHWPDDPAQEKQFYSEIEQVLALSSVRLRGLMTIAPLVDDAEQVRPVFRRMKRLQASLGEAFPGVDWGHLSMGMSGDFDVAVEEGATMIRVGTALFGPRA